MPSILSGTPRPGVSPLDADPDGAAAHGCTPGRLVRSPHSKTRSQRLADRSDSGRPASTASAWEASHARGGHRAGADGLPRHRRPTRCGPPFRSAARASGRTSLLRAHRRGAVAPKVAPQACRPADIADGPPIDCPHPRGAFGVPFCFGPAASGDRASPRLAPRADLPHRLLQSAQAARAAGPA